MQLKHNVHPSSLLCLINNWLGVKHSSWTVPKCTWVFGIENRQNKLQAHDGLTLVAVMNLWGMYQSSREYVPCSNLLLQEEGKKAGAGGFLVFTVYLWSEAKWSHSASLTLCNSLDYNLSGSSVHGIFQARVLEWAAIYFSKYIRYISDMEVKMEVVLFRLQKQESRLLAFLDTTWTACLLLKHTNELAYQQVRQHFR